MSEGTPIRHNLEFSRRKTWREWLSELKSTFGVQHREDESGELVRSFYFDFPKWNVYRLGPCLFPGDEGYEQATHEIGFLISRNTYERMI